MLYCIDFLGQKINLSGISPAKRSQFGPVTTFREFWARSAHFGQNGGWDKSRGARVFLVWYLRDLSATPQQPIFTKFGISVSRRGIRKDIFENFNFRSHLPPKSEIESWSNRHLTQSRLQVTGCTAERYCIILHVVVQGPGSFRGQLFFYDVQLQSYGASKLTNFRILAYFPHTKPLIRTFRWPAYRRMTTISPCGSRRCKGVPSGSAVFLRLLVGELGTPKLSQSFAYGKWLYQYRILQHGASDLDQRCLKTRSSKDKCNFTPNVFSPTPKITPKPHFGELFSANPIL